MRRIAPILFVAVILAAGAQPAAAVDGPSGPITFEQAVNPNGFSWSLSGVPDIDQRRAPDERGLRQGLPGDGKLWCGPTSGTNILAYLADLGFGTGVPSKDWTLDENYDEMTSEILELGDEMNTASGTSYAKFVSALKARLAQAGSQLQAVDSFGVSQFVFYTIEGSRLDPSAEQMAVAGLDGALMFPVTAKFQDVDDPDGEGTVKQGIGIGHVVVAVGASGIYGSPNGTLKVRDPATPAADSVQLPYTTESYAVNVDTYQVLKGDGTVVDRPLGTWSGIRYWTGYYKIVPNTAWVVSPPTSACRKGARKACNEIKRIRAYELVPPGPPPVRNTYDLPGKDPVSALALSAVTPEPAFLLKGSDKVRSLDPVTGKSSNLAEVNGARALVFGGDSQQLFVAGKRKLAALDGITGEVLASQRLAKPLAALAFDEDQDLLVGLTAGGAKLKLFDEGLDSAGTRALDLAGKGKPQLAIAPDGGLLMARSRSAKVFGASVEAVSGSAASAASVRSLKPERRLRLGKDAHGLAVDDLGHILVGQGRKLEVFDAAGNPLPSRFAGSAGAPLAVTRSFSNADSVEFPPSLD
jgi:hypothetical protein